MPKRKAPSGSPRAHKRSAPRRLKGLDRGTSAVVSITEMFEALLIKAKETNFPATKQLFSSNPIHLVVATVCSGTEAPLTALSLFKDAARNLFIDQILTYEHQFSCEIEPFKQAFIRRNHGPPIIFRNVVELGASGATRAMDASGCYRDIPTEKLDMLIAGTSCVDFSTLNTKKDQKTKVNAFLDYGFSTEDLVGDGEAVRPADGVTQNFRDAVNKQLSPEGLESIGESMTTFLSTLNFIMERRPRIVILENVQTAPWKAMQAFWLPSAGYAAKYVRVDSKDFHIPQDRIRGYLVALDAEVFDNGNPDPSAAELVDRACQYVVGLKQRASASVLDFLMDEDDPDYLQARHEITRFGSHGLPKDGKRLAMHTNKIVDWDFCQLRHTIYSQRWNLDTVRRFSKATFSHGRLVTISPPANSWIDYWAHETPRIIDLFDNMYQQLLTRVGCDMNFKAAMFNISQNLDRMPINVRKFGIAPIITPSGMPTLSNRGRPLLGVECLALQGIPRHRLQLAGETQRELRDLAGNAMTATVVGAVVLATLMSAHQQLSDAQKRTGRPAQPQADPPVQVPFLDRALKEVPDLGFGGFNLDASSLLAHGSFNVCRCPPVGAHSRIAYRCRICGKSACHLCKANPVHDFEEDPDVNHRINLSELKVQIQQAMPGVFILRLREEAEKAFSSMQERDVLPVHIKAMRSLLKANICYFSGVKVTTSSMIVEYRSQGSVVRLTLSKVGPAEWYIFPRSSGALGTSPVGAGNARHLPIARGTLTDVKTVDPAAAHWCLREPVAHRWVVAVSEKGAGWFRLDPRTMVSDSRPPHHVEARVHDTIGGDWVSRAQCGTAADGLYTSECRSTGQKLFCFKDVDPTGHPACDRYIISRDVELADTYDYRGDEIKLHVIDPAKLGDTVKVSVRGYWQPMRPLASFWTRVRTSKFEHDSFQLATCETITGSVSEPEPDTCSDTPPLTVLKFSIGLANMPVSLIAKTNWAHRWHDVQETEMQEFLSAILFTTNALERGALFKPDSDLSFDPLRGVPVKFCPDCGVEPPQLHWVKGNKHVVPWEELGSVREYERRLKAMPKPFMAKVNLEWDCDLLYPTPPQADVDNAVDEQPETSKLSTSNKMDVDEEPEASNLSTSNDMDVDEQPEACNLPTNNDMDVDEQPEASNLPTNNDMDVDEEPEASNLPTSNDMGVDEQPEASNLPTRTWSTRATGGSIHTWTTRATHCNSPSFWRVFPHYLNVQLAVHPRTLASRAAAKLAYGFRPRVFSQEILSGVQCWFQIEVGGLMGPNTRFDRFYDSIPTTEDITGLAAIDPDEDVTPESFWRRGHGLFDDQARSVRWMLARETAPAPFLETETEELVLGALNLRIVGRATYPNDGSAFCCRGGIVAHEIGYGKTIVVIALLELRRGFDQSLSIAKRRQAASRFWESELSFIHLKATLVIVPEHITTQWKSELAKFGSAGVEVVVIKRYPELLKMSVSKLEKADVIIVSASIFNVNSYTSSLSHFMDGRGTAGKSDREMQDRYRSCVDTVRKVVRRYRELPGHLDEEEKEHLASERAKEVVEELNDNYQALCQQWLGVGGRREANKRQHQRQAAAEEGSEKRVKKAAKAKAMWTATSFLENFSFARIVLDEFSYNNSGVTLFLSNSLANAKWLLSGTPRCDTLADIVEQGRLLSVHIARPDPCIPTYLDPVTFGPSNKPTAPTEEFRERANHLRSHNFVLDRHRTAETFIKHFVRQDTVNMAQFERETRKIDLELPTLSQMVYAGIRHDLAAAKGNIYNVPRGLRRAYFSAMRHTPSTDNAARGIKAADMIMARFAAMPMTTDTLKDFLGSSEIEVLILKTEIKLAIDKMLWLCHRLPLITPELRARYPRYYQMRTLVEDIFMDMSDARDSWNSWPKAAFGGRDAFNHLARAICPTTAFKFAEGGIEDWLKWRYIDAKTFWPDWYDMPDEYIDGLAAPEKRRELEELAMDAILLSISYPLGRSFARTGGVDWLMSHAVCVGRAIDERASPMWLSTRQTAVTEQARAAAVRDTVPKFTTQQLIDFLKECMKEKKEGFTIYPQNRAVLLAKTKPELQQFLLIRNIAFTESNSIPDLTERYMKFVSGLPMKKSDFVDKRGILRPRLEFPVPNHTFERRGGRMEATLEELTLTYNYHKACREAWFHAFRRHRLYYFMQFVRYSQRHGYVEKYCDGGCLRRPVCKGDTPAFIVLACGHWLCEDHKKEIDLAGPEAFCVARGCGAPLGMSQPNTTIRFTEPEVLSSPDVWSAAAEAFCAQGGKVPPIVSLIKDTPDDDKAVLFTYLEELAVAVRDKLVQEGISVLSMVGGGEQADLAQMLDDFKAGKAKVLIIDPTAEHAAGSNLTIANHVIFAGPVLERDPFLRKMHYRQALGRCLRNGQKKKVVIYTLVTKGTIDEDLYDSEMLESRVVEDV